MSFFRRAGALIARFFESAADPAAVANEFKLYSKDAAGVTQLFGRSDDGTVHQITPGGSAVTSQRTAIVDPALGSDATGTFGQLGRSFATIQAALTAIPTPIDAATARTVWTILVSPGTYDEDLTVDLTQGKKVVLASWGPWNLGLFDAADWQPSGTPRSIAITTSNATNFDFINGSFSIQPMLPPSQGDDNQEASSALPRISGQMTMTGVFAGTPSINVTMQAVVYGIANAAIVAGATADIELRIYRSRIRGTVVGGATVLADAVGTRFDDLIDILGYGHLSECYIGDGMTVAGTAPSSPTVPGFYDCRLLGVFTGPAFDAFWFDRVTDYWFVTNVCTFAGGASSRIVETSGSAAASAGASNVLTFRPGGADIGPVVFNDFNDLYAQLVALRTATVDSGLFTIVFDNSLGNCNIPAGATYDMIRTGWVGAVVENPTDISFANGVVGAVITNLFSITGCDITNGNGDAPLPPIRLSAGQTLYLDRARIQNGDEAIGIVYVMANATIHMGDESTLQGTTSGSGQPGVLVADAITLTLHMNGPTSKLDGDGAVYAEGASSVLTVFINSSSARYVLQTTFTIPPSIRLDAAHGWYPIDPNGIVTADAGALLSGAVGGSDIYRNTDGATTWGLMPVTPVPPDSVGASWITTINALSAAPGTPSEWQAFEPPLLPWLAGDVVTIDFQIQSPNDLSLFFAQAGTLITGSPVITGTSANPWTGRITFTVISATEGRTLGFMLSDSAGVTLEINVSSPPATFTFDPSVPVQLMLLNSVEATAYVGTLEARLSRGATVSAVT